ncbi:MAG TPA: hypothetical protein VLM79_36390 [Kofleriaceae bacterium]|nr:hypothetical protein [Kofleriaceae bacterium]
MGIHAIQAFAPNVGIDDAEPCLERALAAVGRQVHARHPFPLAGGPPWRKGALHWDVVQLFERGTVLRTYDVDADRWDPGFLRALSAATDGFVEGLDHHRNREHYAAATMFAGRTLELAEYDAAVGLSGIGLPPDDERRGATRFEDNHRRRFKRMADLMADSSSMERVIAAGEWDVSPAVGAFSTDGETPTSRAVFGWVDESQFRDALPRLGAGGWRWRPRITPRLQMACIELARDGTLDPEQCARWARTLAAPYVAFEAPGAGRPMPFGQSFDDGNDNNVGRAIGFDQLSDPLFQLSGMFSEGVGMLFGANAAWRDIGEP